MNKNKNNNNNLNININSNVKLNSNVNNANNNSNNNKNNNANNNKNNNNKANNNENNSISDVVNNNTKPNINNEQTPSNTIVKNVPNENNEAINKIKEYYKYGKEKILKVNTLIDNTPILIKILNIVIPFSISYIFTKMYYNLYVSIFFAIITVLAILFMTKSIFYTILYLIFYIWLVTMATSEFYNIVGAPFIETDINKGGPFNCIGNYVQINNDRLLKSDSSGSFSYSYWININSTGINNPNVDKSSSKDNNNWFNYRNKDWKLIFYRGNEMPNGITSLDVQYPGFWLTPILNNLVIVFQSNGSPVERIEMINIPLNTWVNISTVVERKSVSIYINGLLDRTLNLQQSSPDIGKNNIYIGENNDNKNNNIGFPGFLAQLTYFNYALTADIVYKGYTYNKKIIEQYENKIKNDYVISNLITNSDYYSENKTS